jgi:phosphopantothenoylcysteine decarboxylase/phosphopantothenate--cysteine ligase|tara:strand:+ start:1373 stop:2614 length:1242 start_codon:yes stop_codon:yes gene_type:complete
MILLAEAIMSVSTVAGTMAVRDTDVEVQGDALSGRHVLLGVTGGIAAVDTVRIARELRRHGAEITVVMTNAAQRIITPLAVRWATQGRVITDWDGDMEVLNGVDGVVVVPTTRDTLASHLHGLQNGPLLMALSVARSRGSPIMMVPSMHLDLAKDPMTDELVERARQHGIHVHWGEEEEGKRKTPSHQETVARFSHIMNAGKANRKAIVVTLGATQSAIDDVRFVQNYSSGGTGFALADDLYRHGHDVTCVAGVTKNTGPAWLPLIIRAPEPNQMLGELMALANDDIDAWIHAAAVLDYVVEAPAEGKIASQQGTLNINLVESEKHIMALKERCNDAIRIGFKLESGIKQKDLIYRATAQIEKAGMTAVIANRLEDLNDSTKPRGYLVDAYGSHFVLENEVKMCEAVRTFIER